MELLGWILIWVALLLLIDSSMSIILGDRYMKWGLGYNFDASASSKRSMTKVHNPYIQ